MTKGLVNSQVKRLRIERVIQRVVEQRRKRSLIVNEKKKKGYLKLRYDKGKEMLENELRE